MDKNTLDKKSIKQVDLKNWANLSRSVLNGIVGDYLEKEHNPLAIEMAFYHQNQADMKGFGSVLENAKTSLLAAFAKVGYNIPSGSYDPFTLGFEIGDSADQLLDQVQIALEGAEGVASYEELVILIKDGNLNALPIVESSNNQNDGLGDNGDNGDNGTIAAACFNADLFTAGTRVSLEYVMPANADIYQFEDLRRTHEFEVIGDVVFEGETLLKTQLSMLSYDEDDNLASEYNNTRYDRYSIAEKVVATVYSDDVSTSYGLTGYTSSWTTRNEPAGYSWQYDLSPGESYSEAWQSTTVNAGSTSLASNTNQVTFVGLELVSLPSGDIQACRFDSSFSNSYSYEGQEYDSSSEATYWFSVGAGVNVKTNVDGSEHHILRSGSINGVDL